MARPKYEITHLTELRPESQGEPGQRVFQIIAAGETGSAVIWVEKEQLFQLSLAVQQLFATLTKPEADEAGGDSRPASTSPALDFKAVKIAVGHDDRNQMFLIDAHDVEGEDEEDPTVRLWATHTQISRFADEGLRVCAAGRPLCPLCAAPMDPEGHLCPKVNGHALVREDG